MGPSLFPRDAGDPVNSIREQPYIPKETAVFMKELIRLTTSAELPAEGEVREFVCADRTICVANLHGQITALDNVCLHRGGPLGQGLLEDGKLVCPWHGWQFDPKTGQSLQNPKAKLAVFPLEIRDGEVMILL
jgi:nitrite reductase (NADH) small subunit